MSKSSNGPHNCKTSERIADEYCCLDFRDADQLCEVFGYREGKYFLCGACIDIDYCPWCAKQIPCQEKL